MGKRQVGAGGVGWIVGAVAGLALAAGCDSGESVSPVLYGGSSGTGGTAVAGSHSGGQAGTATSGSGTGGSGASGGGLGGGGGAGANADGGGEGGATEGGEGGVGGQSSGGVGWGGLGGAISLGGLGGFGGSGNPCSGSGVRFVPQPSNVLLLVDGSGTMFAGVGATVWDRVREALLPTIDAMDAELNLGFLAMSAEFDACPAFHEVAPAKNNYTPIAAKYSAIGKPTKGESPFPLALDRAAQLLDGKAGDKHVLFIIDGEPDYCNDGQPDCAIDSTVWRIQKLKAAGVTTHVAALPFPLPPLSGDVSATRQSYANAGAGLPVSPFGGTESLVYYTCYSQPKWADDHVATGKGAETLIGTYSSTPGTAPFSALDPSDANGLRASFQQLLAKTRSCRFDVQGAEVIVDAAKGQASVSLNGAPLPYSAQNGWSLPSSKVVELTGSACATYRATAAAQLDFEFPCDVLK